MLNFQKSAFFRTLLVAFAALLITASCGSDSESAPTDTGSDSTSQSAASTDSDETTSQQSAAGNTDSSSSDDSQMDENGSKATTDNSAKVTQFCELIAENDRSIENLDLTDPELVRDYFYKSRDALSGAIAEAPVEIQDDLIQVLKNYDESIVILENYDFDFFAAITEIDAIGSEPATEAATERLDSWELAMCPTESRDDGEDTDNQDAFEEALESPEFFLAMLESEAGRELVLEGMLSDGELSIEQAECLIDHPNILDIFSLFTGEEPEPELFSTLITVLAECDIPLDSEDDDEPANDFEEAFESPEFLIAMLETEAGREMIIEGIINDDELSREQAECLIDHPNLLDIFSLFTGEEPTPDIFPTIIEVWAECDIPLE